MANYAPQGSVAEWGKWVIYTLGRPFGFTTPLKAAVVGMLIWAVSWTMLPGAYSLLLHIPLVSERFPEIGLTEERFRIINYVLIVIGSYLGLGCWCRVAVICMPKKFDRNKIKGIPI